MITASHSAREVPGALCWAEYARNGDIVQIRPIVPSDKARERAFLERLSAEYRANRFIGLVKETSDGVAEELTCVDPINEVTLGAFAHPGHHREVEIGAACYRKNEDGTRCDCTVTVDPAWQKLGVGTALMRHLIEVARSRGIRRMYSTAIGHGRAQHTLAERLGFRACPDPEDPIVTTFELDLA